jgi:hypothetical protein
VIDRDPGGHPLSGLLIAGPRLGWQFRDPSASMTAFTEPPPAPPPPMPALPSGNTTRLSRSLILAGGAGFAVAGLIGCCGLAAGGLTRSDGVIALAVLGGVTIGLGTVGVVAGVMWARHARMTAAVRAAWAPWWQHAAEVTAWRYRAQAHRDAERRRVATETRWQSTGPDPHTSRLDIAGGEPAAWRDLITVAGSADLARRRATVVVDLTGDGTGADLADLSAAGGVPVDWQTLPGDTDLLSGLSGAQLVDVLVEAVHGDGDRSVRALRATDTRILSAIVGALGDRPTPARIADGLHALMGLPDTSTLSAAERRYIADELFPTDYLTGASAALQRLEAQLYPLRDLTCRPRPPAGLTVLTVVRDGTEARAELLDDLVVGWITRRIAAGAGSGTTLILAGADRLAPRHIDRLADVCARGDVMLILLWRHLRDHAQQALGSGAVAFMRLRNAEEATRAADHIGRQHRFVLSGLTRTVGDSTGWSTSTGTSRSTSTMRAPTRRRLGYLIDHAHAWVRDVALEEVGTSTSYQTSTNTGVNTSEAGSTQRVYEYAVEPTVLQSLPPHALLLIGHGPYGPAIRALDCNPAIVTLPGVDMDSTAGYALPAVPVAPALPARLTEPGR